jgi:hypothetical protein
MDSVVQFLRNFCCCIKDLNLLSDTWLYDPSVKDRYYAFSSLSTATAKLIVGDDGGDFADGNENTSSITSTSPLAKTTPLEALISLFQCYVVLVGGPNAVQLFLSSQGKLQRLYRLLDRSGPISCDSDRLVRASMFKEAVLALRSMFVAFNCFFISLSFIWLTANSWHIIETDWIGGLPALIHALTVMNICLTPLLYYMYRDAEEHFAKAGRMQLLSVRLEEGKVSEEDMGLTTLEALTGWSPFWKAGVSFFETVDVEREMKLLAVEQERVQTMLHAITGETAVAAMDGDATSKAAAAGALQQRRREVQRERAAALQPLIRASKLEGYREWFYFIVNAIAWYGYGACIVVYYWPDETAQPTWLRAMLLHYTNADADWHGNFAGDLMWTIEPLIALGSPYLIGAVRNPGKTAVEAKAKTE